MAEQSAEVGVERMKKVLPCEKDGQDEDAQRIEHGFDIFKKNIFDKNPEYFAELAEGQHPKFLVVACSDSRVSPSIILNFKLGEAFISRNIANMVPQFDQLRHTEIGSVIEYAVKSLEVQNILVVGHSRCGGIERLMNLPDPCHTYDFIDNWVKIGLPAKIKVLQEAKNLTFEEKTRLCEIESVRNSLKNLLTYPFVRNAVVKGTLTLRGGYYDFVKGSFEQWTMFTDSLPPVRPIMPLPIEKSMEI